MFVTALNRRTHHVLPLPWVHKWDFTNVSASTVPDIVGSLDLTLIGSYTADSSGVTPTANDAGSQVALSSLGIDVGDNGDAFTIILTLTSVGSSGPSNFGRFYTDQDTLQCNFGDNDTANIRYRDTTFVIKDLSIADATLASSVSALNDSDGVLLVLVDGVDYSASDSSNAFSNTYLYLLNREDFDRSPDATCVGAGIISKVLSPAEALQAEAELLAL